MDDDDERLTDWGASRRTYYGGDTADLEIGQKDEDAVAEEALARVQQREALDALDEDDFALDGDDDDDADEAESGDLFAALGRKGGARKAVDRKAITQRALEVLEAPVEGAEPSATILRLLREQQALGLLCDAGFYELLRAEGIDATQHPIAQRLPIALRSLEASASLSAPETVATPTPTEEAPQEEDDLYAASQERRRKKRQKYEVKPRFGGWRDELDAPAADDRRAASRAVVRNKGLAPHRTNKYRNPRVKKKIKYAKAVVRRKGQVREMRNEAEGYGGEASGVRKGVGKSRRIT